MESTIYEGRDKLDSEEFLEFCQESEVDKLKTQIEAENEWLDETVSNDIEDYNEHYRNIHSILGRIKKRIVEYMER